MFVMMMPSRVYGKEYPNWFKAISESSQRLENETKQRQMVCLALTIYHEARGETPKGQKAVASVVLNRKKSPRFPNTICEVVFQPKQFSYLSKKSKKPRELGSWTKAMNLAESYIKGTITSGNNYLFFNSLGRGNRIGRHYFR